MRNRRILATLLVSFLIPASLPAQTTAAASLLILSKKEHTLAIVDAASLKVLDKVPVGEDPHEVIASSDGSTAYVSNYGSGAYHTLAVIDLVHHKALAPVDLGALRGPHGLAFVGGKTWFTAEAAKVVGRYDPATQKVDLVLGTGQNRTHMIYVADDEKRIVTTNVNSGTVSILDLEPVQAPPPPAGGSAAPGRDEGAKRTDWNETVVRVGHGSEGFDLSPDHREAWVANAQDGTVSVIDMAAKRVVQTLALDVDGANRLKFTPDGKHVLISTLSGNDLVIVDVATRKEAKRLPIGHGAAGIVMQPDGARAFVACTPDDSVAVIDLSTLEVTGHINAGGGPDGMAWAVRQP